MSAVPIEEAGATPAKAPVALADRARSAVLDGTSSRVRAFDLRRQETIERARLRRLDPMLETVAHRIAGALTAAIRQPVHVDLQKTDQAPWEEFASSLPDPTFISSAALLPLEGRVVLHVPTALVFQLMDFYLGGDGEVQPDREQLTDLERSIVGALVGDVWSELPPSLATFISLNVAIVQNSSSAVLVQVGRPGVMCLVIELKVAIGDHAAEMVQLAMPQTVLLPVLEQLERHQAGEGLEVGHNRRDVRLRLLTVPVELKVGYPPIGLTPAELLGLRPGDVIPVHQEYRDEPYELELKVGDVRYGTGVLVENGKRLACTVVSKKENPNEC